MKLLKPTLTALACIVCSTALNAHDPAETHPRNEIAISGGAVYAPDDTAWGGGAHLHYFRTFTPRSRWSWGLGVEQVWAEASHWTVGAGIRFSPAEDLELSVMPGMTFSGLHGHKHDGEPVHDDGISGEWSLHAEIAYSLLEIGHLHIGPSVDYSYTKDDSHFMFGIHAAVGF